MKDSNLFKLSSALVFTLSCISQIAEANTKDNVKQEIWVKSSTESPELLEENSIGDNKTNLVFIRKTDDDPVDSSANISIDEKFLTSLHPGHYSQQIYCSGIHDINVVLSNVKNLSISRTFSGRVSLEPNKTTYFFVDVDNFGLPKLSRLDLDDAQALLNNSLKQTHQISRVVDNCPDLSTNSSSTNNIELDTPINLSVNFDSNNINPVNIYNPAIETIAEFMSKNEKTSVVIEGHTDNQGSDSYNLKLSEARANNVKSELVNTYGIEPSRISAIGYGESLPIDDNSTPEGRYNNRRVVAILSAE